MKNNLKPFWERIKDFYLVWNWSKKYNRFVCTNRFENQREAEVACKQTKRNKHGARIPSN